MSKKNAQVKNQQNPPKGNGKPSMPKEARVRVKKAESPIVKVNKNGVAVFKEGMHPRQLRAVREQEAKA